jgi:hypothetical protein
MKDSNKPEAVLSKRNRGNNFSMLVLIASVLSPTASAHTVIIATVLNRNFHKCGFYFLTATMYDVCNR